jgi:hypothetical protein
VSGGSRAFSNELVRDWLGARIGRRGRDRLSLLVVVGWVGVAAQEFVGVVGVVAVGWFGAVGPAESAVWHDLGGELAAAGPAVVGSAGEEQLVGVGGAGAVGAVPPPWPGMTV